MSIGQVLVVGHRYRFTLRRGDVVIGIYRGRQKFIRGSDYYMISITKGKRRGYAAGYSVESVIDIEDA